MDETAEKQAQKDRQYKSNPWWNTAKRLIEPAKFYITEEQRHVILKRAMDVPFGVCVCILTKLSLLSAVEIPQTRLFDTIDQRGAIPVHG